MTVLAVWCMFTWPLLRPRNKRWESESTAMLVILTPSCLPSTLPNVNALRSWL